MARRERKLLHEVELALKYCSETFCADAMGDLRAASAKPLTTPCAHLFHRYSTERLFRWSCLTGGNLRLWLAFNKPVGPLMAQGVEFVFLLGAE
jgi:hypothetical protein